MAGYNPFLAQGVRTYNPFDPGQPVTPQPQSVITSAPAVPDANLQRSTGSQLPGFLSQSESGGNWQAQNKQGYFGRAQFGPARFGEAIAAGAIPQGTTREAFLQSPELQKAAENWHFGDIDKFIGNKGLGQMVGQSIGGTPITMDGMRAVAHLGGKGGLEKFISTQGQYNPADANGTRLSDYLAKGATAYGGEPTALAQAQNASAEQLPQQAAAPAAAPAAPAAQPQQGLLGMLGMNNETTDKIGAFVGGDKFQNAAKGVSALAQALGGGSGGGTKAPQLAPVVHDDNKPDASFMQMLDPRRRRMMGA